MYYVHCSLYNVHCTLYSEHCTPRTDIYMYIQCTLYSVKCTLYTVYHIYVSILTLIVLIIDRCWVYKHMHYYFVLKPMPHCNYTYYTSFIQWFYCINISPLYPWKYVLPVGYIHLHMYTVHICVHCISYSVQCAPVYTTNTNWSNH